MNFVTLTMSLKLLLFSSIVFISSIQDSLSKEYPDVNPRLTLINIYSDKHKTRDNGIRDQSLESEEDLSESDEEEEEKEEEIAKPTKKFPWQTNDMKKFKEHMYKLFFSGAEAPTTHSPVTEFERPTKLNWHNFNHIIKYFNIKS